MADLSNLKIKDTDPASDALYDKVNAIADALNNDTSRMAEQAMPSHNHVTLTIGASGARYTAPSNGYFSVRATGTSSDNWIEFTTEDSFLNEGIYGTARWNYKKFYPARVGDVVTITYQNMNFDYIVFIYAEGDV